MSEVELNHIERALEELSYPVTREEASAELEGTTLVMSDDEADLGGLIGETNSESYQRMADLKSEMNNVLPRGAVGEPYQSEGEG